MEVGDEGGYNLEGGGGGVVGWPFHTLLHWVMT